jgi:transposase IS116/IS110/IS902 family protein
VEKLLEDAQIKLPVVAADSFGVSGRAMMAALIAGERDPKVLAQLARGRLRAKLGVLEEALTGHFSDHHGFLLATMLARIDHVSIDIATLQAKIAREIAPFGAAVDQLDEIPGVGRTAAHVLIAEIGVDMGRLPTPAHLAAWARLAPGVTESAGKRKGTAATGHGNPYLARVLGEAAVTAGKTNTFSGSATGASPAAVAPSGPSSRSAAPSWSSSGTCWLIPTPASTTSAPASTTPATTLIAPSATTSASSKRSATRSPWNPPPEQAPIDSPLDPAPLRSAGCCRLPLTVDFRISSGSSTACWPVLSLAGHVRCCIQPVRSCPAE